VTYITLGVLSVLFMADGWRAGLYDSGALREVQQSLFCFRFYDLSPRLRYRRRIPL
jgi:hypothetical protein